MSVADKIIQIISDAKAFIAPVTAASDLYADLGFDSLSFICLLLDIEKAFSIKFGLEEMGECVNAGRLIAFVENKIKETIK